MSEQTVTMAKDIPVEDYAVVIAARELMSDGARLHDLWYALDTWLAKRGVAVSPSKPWTVIDRDARQFREPSVNCVMAVVEALDLAEQHVLAKKDSG